jgi:putative transposase
MSEMCSVDVPRCWYHKQPNVLATLHKSAHPGALAALRDICNAEDLNKAHTTTW